MNNKIDRFIVKVSKVIDGDTFYSEPILIDLPDFTFTIKNPRFRMLGVNTPERNRKGYKEATEFTNKMLPIGSEVEVEITGKDVFDRFLCIVHLKDQEETLNELLLKNKYAVVYKR